MKIKANPIDVADFVSGEHILVLDPLEYIDPAQVTRGGDTLFDQSFGSDVSFVDDPLPGLAKPVTRGCSRQRSRPSCLYSGYHPSQADSKSIYSIAISSFQTFFIRPRFNVSLWSVSVNDGYVIYGHLLKSIISCYELIKVLPKSEHTPLINVYILIFGPHASSFEDVLKAMVLIIFLDQGMQISINSKILLIYHPILAFIDNMLQQ